MTQTLSTRPTGRFRRPGRRALLIGSAVTLALLAGLIWLALSLAHRDTAPAAAGRGPGGGQGPGGGGPGPGGGGRRGGPASTVGVATAATADVPVVIEALGTVTPTATVTVRPQVAGVVTQVLYREGQMVRKGQTLIQIDPRPFQMQLLQAQGTLARDEALLDNGRLVLSRYQTLLNQDSIARQDVDTQAALVRQLQGTVTTDRAAVGTAQLSVGFSRIVAPVSGRIGLRVVDVGNYVTSGQTNGVAVITTVTPIDVVFTVPQDDVPRIEARARSGATLPTIALDRNRVQTLGTGRFSTLDNQVDTTTGTVKGKASFPNTDGGLFPSQFVNLRLELDKLRGAVVVPSAAVRQGQDGVFVWLVSDKRTVNRRNVVSGQGFGDKVVITSGLKAGDRVVTEGGDRLTEGARIQLPGQAPAGGARDRRRGGRRRGPQGARPAD